MSAPRPARFPRGRMLAWIAAVSGVCLALAYFLYSAIRLFRLTSRYWLLTELVTSAGEVELKSGRYFLWLDSEGYTLEAISLGRREGDYTITDDRIAFGDRVLRPVLTFA